MRSECFGILVASVLVTACLVAARAEEQPTLQQVLERLKKVEAELAAQKASNAAQKEEISQLRTVAEQKGSVNDQVDHALSQRALSVYHDNAIHPRRIKIGGGLDISYQYNLNQPFYFNQATLSPGELYPNNGRGFDRMDHNTFDVHLVELFFDGRATKPGEAGFRFDLAFGWDDIIGGYSGTDAGQRLENDHAVLEPDDPNAPLEFWDYQAPPQSLHLQQAYIDYIAPIGNGLRFAVGKMVNPMGFEVIENWNNWNATRSFSTTKLFPATLTGVFLDYPVFSNWTVSAYFGNGISGNIEMANDAWLDWNEGKAFYLQSSWQPTENISWTVTGGMDHLLPSFPGENQGEYWTWYANSVLTWKPLKKLAFALDAAIFSAQKMSETDSAHGGDPYYEWARSNDPANAWYVAGYFKWDLLEKLYWSGRVEYLDDRGSLVTESNAAYRADRPGEADDVQLMSFTSTFGYTVCKPMMIRFEYRHDLASVKYFAGKHAPDGYSRVSWDFLPWERHSQDTLTLNFTYKF